MKIKSRKKLKIALLVLVTGLAFLIANPKPTGVKWLDKNIQKLKINLGLDLQGGVHLVYEVDMKNIKSGKEKEALSGIQDVIERRVNAFGVTEPIVQPSRIGNSYRLIVELAGIKDIEEAKKMIKETPFLEFKEQGEKKTKLNQEEEKLLAKQLDLIEKENKKQTEKAQATLKKALAGDNFENLAKENSEDPGSKEKGGNLGFFKKGVMLPEFEKVAFSDDFKKGQVYPELVKTSFGLHIIKKIDERGAGENKEINASHILFKISDKAKVKEYLTQQMLQPQWKNTGLTGGQLESSQVSFNQQGMSEPVVSLQFNKEGKDLFKQITERNINKPVAIFLDGQIISAPRVNDVIRDGRAIISGGFNIKEAKELSQRLNTGALPVPIKLISQQSIEASLGADSLNKSVKAGLWGLLAVAIFMIIYYRLAGVVAVIALVVYISLMVTIFKLSSLTKSFGITLTLSGIAGFILSIGMAVDANILIFERMKEEIKRGRDLKSAHEEGFKRAWTSIRDGNFSTILTALILMIFGASFIQGFAIILVIGVLLSMFTAIVITKVLLSALLGSWFEKRKWIVLTNHTNKKSKKEGRWQNVS